VDFNLVEVRRNLLTELVAANEGPPQGPDLGIPIDWTPTGVPPRGPDLGFPSQGPATGIPPQGPDLGIPIDSKFEKKIKSEIRNIKNLKQLVAFSKNFKLELKSKKNQRKLIEAGKNLNRHIRQLIKLKKSKDLKKMKLLFKNAKNEFLSNF
jgi:hypothetical protein